MITSYRPLIFQLVYSLEIFAYWNSCTLHYFPISFDIDFHIDIRAISINMELSYWFRAFEIAWLIEFGVHIVHIYYFYLSDKTATVNHTFSS